MTMSIFDIAGRAMSAQLVRLNTSASNLANAGAAASSAEAAFRPLKPVFQTHYDGNSGRATVGIAGVVQANATPSRRYEPGHPLADGQGYVHMPPSIPTPNWSRSWKPSASIATTSRFWKPRNPSLSKH